jgi:PRC-barrel domain
MAHYGTLRDYRFNDVDEATDDVRGSKVYGPDDEKLGKIDDVIFDHSTGQIQYVVIDTGGWLSSKKFVVPPQTLRPSLDHEDDFTVYLTKEQIETFPPYNESDLESDDKWSDYDGRYRSQWESSPVMHRAATDRNITPTTKQQIDASSGTLGLANDDQDEAELDVTPMRTEASLDVDPSGPSLRWDTFEDRLRQRRQEIVSFCATCKSSPASETISERDARRKAS